MLLLPIATLDSITTLLPISVFLPIFTSFPNKTLLPNFTLENLELVGFFKLWSKKSISAKGYKILRVFASSKRTLGTITFSQVSGKNLDSFLKLPAKHRLKDDKSLIDKAFYRADKQYRDPYREIEDKVGARFVVLLIEDIKDICKILIKKSVFKCRLKEF